jgi:DNA polymerase-3 subunit alpha
MTKKFQYGCGCSFDIVDNGETKKILFEPNIDHISLDCSRTWDLISDGNTKGCFQLESRLGRSMAKKLKPSNIEELSALISIMRPGCLEAVRDGKTVSNHFIDKKNGQESIDYFHPSLETILRNTYGEMVYQEQAMEIAKVIAGFNLQEADMLRKAIGKKKPEEMAKVKQKFIAGTQKTNIVSLEQAEQIFGWIEKSQRYSFNKSHAVSYAINGYLSAYAKAHFPKIFFASYLRFAKDKIDPQAEIKELVQNATEMDIVIHTPDIRNMNQFFILKNNKIYFGLTDIKGVGASVFEKLKNMIQDNSIDLNNINWLNLLFRVLLNINSIAAKALIESGATSFIKQTRNSMVFEYNTASNLTKKETAFLIENISNYDTLSNALKYLLDNGKINKNRRKIIEDMIHSIFSPPFSLEDTAEWISDVEDAALGCSITCAKVDMYDISMTNTTCRDFKNGINKDNIILGGEIDFINITKTKSGKTVGSEMAFVTLCDTTGSIDSIIFFPEKYKQYKNVLFPGNVIIVKGNRSKNGDSLVVENAYVAKS